MSTIGSGAESYELKPGWISRRYLVTPDPDRAATP